MVYQVGSPAILDGNMFLPDTGMPIWNSERSRTRLAVWLPEPLTVATWMLKSLTIRRVAACVAASWTATHPEGKSFGGAAARMGENRKRCWGNYSKCGAICPRQAQAPSALLTAAPRSAGLLTTWTPA